MAALPPNRPGFVSRLVQNNNFCVPERYTDLEYIRHGPQGIMVCSALDMVTQTRVSIDKYTRVVGTQLDAMGGYRELQCMRRIEHQNIIPLLKVFTPQGSSEEFQDMYFVKPLINFSLSNLIGMNLNHARISSLVYQILCAVQYLHLCGIMHRNLKPDNIMVNNDGSLKLANMGLPRAVNIDSILTPYGVPDPYKAPEVLLRLGETPEVDVWSIGCIMAKMFKRSSMFYGSTCYLLYRDILEKLGTPSARFRAGIPSSVKTRLRIMQEYPGQPFDELFPNEMFPPEGNEHNGLNSHQARDLLPKMLVIDRVARISVSDALNHPYFSAWHAGNQQPAPIFIDQDVYDRHYSTEEWKVLLYNELMDYKNLHGDN